MRLICPSCGATHSIEALQNDADARECIAIAAKLGREIAGRVFAYLALFRPRKSALRWARAKKLLMEIEALAAKPRISHDRKPARANTARAWGEGLDKIIARPPRTLPLKNHNYLLAIIYEIADEEDKATEKRHIEREKSGAFRSAPGETETGPGLERIKELEINKSSNYDGTMV